MDLGPSVLRRAGIAPPNGVQGVALFGEDGDGQILDALNSHRVRIQASIGRQVRAKKTPILSFRPDDVIRSAEHIERILQSDETLPARAPEPDDVSDGDDPGDHPGDGAP